MNRQHQPVCGRGSVVTAAFPKCFTILPAKLNSWTTLLSIFATLLTIGGKTLAAPSDASSPQLADMGIEELINVEIMSVSKKQMHLHDAASAIAVLTQDDIRRLGVTSIPEALRAVPGVQVARINSSTWAISARGFNDPFSNKLLVLVDGRTVYTPTFAGVYWDAQDLVLEDLDRIEIIRGPGATLWGANAVNGVINIISKSAKQTQGGLMTTGFGSEEQPITSLRYGGQLRSNLFYRVYGKYFNRAEFDDKNGNGMGDDWWMARGGFRLDWEATREDVITLQGDYYKSEFGESVGKSAASSVTNAEILVNAPASGGNILARWTRRYSDDSELKLQTYYDRYSRKHPFGGGSLVAGADFLTADGPHETRDTWDIDLQHRFHPFTRHDVVWGAGFRFTQDDIHSNDSEIIATPDRDQMALYNLFLQDDITVIDERFHVTLGTKLEHNDMTGFEIEPGARILFKPTERQSLWTSISRSVRIPSRLERDVRVNFAAFPLPPGGTPAQVSLLSTPDVRAEELIAFEIGYRVEPTRQLRFDATLFFNEYKHLIESTVVADQFEVTPAPPHVLYAPNIHTNRLRDHTYGAELLVEWLPTEHWRLTAGYTCLHSPGLGISNVRSSPRHQFNLRSSVELGAGWEANAAAYFVDGVSSTSQATEPENIPSYVRLDLGLTWRPRESFEISVWGQNLLDNAHSEFASYKTARLAEVPRTVYGAITWRF